jgi:c-di-GMP-binding flagellar brake protein YcgR
LSTLKKQQLEDAREKYHLLLTGQAARVLVDQNGERVEFTAASKSHLADYIQQLEIDTGTANMKARRPIGFVL